MTTAYTIKDVADRSGFTAGTLRYYEEIGLLPQAARTAAGYRLYDDRTLNRLAFIARAKQLGCSLEEVADLATAWDGGRCGPVQDRLRTLVAAKVAAAQRQIAELMTLTGELQQAGAALERHRPQGACDDQCGCVSEPADAAEIPAVAQPVVLSPKSICDRDSPPIACTLGSDSLRGRAEQWQTLLAHVDRRESIHDGVRAIFGPATPLADLISLTAAEQDCCRFFGFAITVDSRGVALEVRAPADALPIVTSLFGAPS